MQVELEVYVERECFVCRRSAGLAADIHAAFPEIHVDLIDLAEAGGAHRHLVAAAPTFILNGSVFSLGNPAPADLHAEVARLIAETTR